MQNMLNFMNLSLLLTHGRLTTEGSGSRRFSKIGTFFRTTCLVRCDFSILFFGQYIDKEYELPLALTLESLTDGIYVRVYEDRMDLLRAVIVGAYGTPYQDGLFFFDFHLPPEYPDVPPVRYSDPDNCCLVWKP